jgi:hypothetical protein
MRFPNAVFLNRRALVLQKKKFTGPNDKGWEPLPYSILQMFKLVMKNKLIKCSYKH